MQKRRYNKKSLVHRREAIHDSEHSASPDIREPKRVRWGEKSPEISEETDSEDTDSEDEIESPEKVWTIEL